MKKLFAIYFVLAVLCAVLFAAPDARAGRENVKYVFMMIADGWGINHVNATNYWEGAGSQSYQNFPTHFYMSTYSQSGIDAAAPDPAYDVRVAWTDFNYMMLRATDSASSATAMSTGVKTYDYRINIDPSGYPLFIVTERAKELGKSVGVVTNVAWSYSTPAGYVAHNVSKNNYTQIAQEMIESDADVMMGCGHPNFNDNHEPVTPSIPSDWQYVGGEIQWNNLIGGSTDWTLIQSRAEFQALITDPNPPVKVCGTAECRQTTQEKRSLVAGEGANGSALPYAAPLNDVPTLEEMTRGAINVLDENPNGFFLMVEGGAIDWANHSWLLNRCIEEMIEFNDAVDSVIAWVEANSNWDESLLIVTGDHECGYLWGPGSGTPATFNEIIDNGAGNLPGGWYYSTGHSNSLIPFYSKGTGGGWFSVCADETDPVRGLYIDNTEIADIIFCHYDECFTSRLVISINAGNAVLNWSGFGTNFIIHGSPVPFAPGDSLGTVSDTTWTDVNASTRPSPYFYSVTATE